MAPPSTALSPPVFLTLAPPSLQLPILRAQTFVHKWLKVRRIEYSDNMQGVMPKSKERI